MYLYEVFLANMTVIMVGVTVLSSFSKDKKKKGKATNIETFNLQLPIYSP